MNVFVAPSKIAGSISAPVSKSMFQRAVAAALLSEGESQIIAGPISRDGEVALQVAEALGATIQRPTASAPGNHFRIAGGWPKILATSGELCLGESGLSFRMFAPIAALGSQPFRLSAQGSLLGRPVDMLEEPLRQLGASIASTKGLAPVHLQGPLRGGNIELDASSSSQFLTGLLMALPCCPQDSLIHTKNLKSRPYIDMTLELLAAFGIHIEREGYELFRIPGGQSYQACQYQVEGDYSGAAFLFAAASSAGVASSAGAASYAGEPALTVHNLKPQSAQGDRAFLDALKQAGTAFSWEANALSIWPAALKPFSFDATDCPDLFPPLAALAAACPGTSHLTGVSRLKHKESNRGLTIQSEFKKIGVQIEIDGDIMHVYGGRPIKGGRGSSHNDHRIAMALALLGLISQEGVYIDDAQAIDKSYPGFFDDIQALGAKISKAK